MTSGGPSRFGIRISWGRPGTCPVHKPPGDSSTHHVLRALRVRVRPEGRSWARPAGYEAETLPTDLPASASQVGASRWAVTQWGAGDLGAASCHPRAGLGLRGRASAGWPELSFLQERLPVQTFVSASQLQHPVWSRQDRPTDRCQPVNCDVSFEDVTWRRAQGCHAVMCTSRADRSTGCPGAEGALGTAWVRSGRPSEGGFSRSPIFVWGK